jgi:hypothetical protein
MSFIHIKQPFCFYVMVFIIQLNQIVYLDCRMYPSLRLELETPAHAYKLHTSIFERRP